MMDFSFEVFESNGGNLTLLVYDAEGEVVYLRTGYEHAQGCLLQDLAALDAGEDPTTWDGNELEDYPDGQALGPWGELIADSFGEYPDKMGAAGLRELVKNKDIHCIPKLYVLMDHDYTRKEAEEHLKNGTIVYSPEEWITSLQEWDTETDDPCMELFNLSQEEMLERCKKGEFSADCVATGLYKGDPALPYVIVYVL